MEITKNYVDMLAGSSASNAKSQVKKFIETNISADGTLLFGKCQGSGKNPYICSYDFIDEGAPIGRCSCPSRQYPCKHSLGLLYAYESGVKFTQAEIPEDILQKREKMAKREEKKQVSMKERVEKRENSAPTAQKISSAKKRIQMQLDGLCIAKTLIENILRSGIAGLDAAAIKALEQQAENLGSYYIGGIKNAFNEVLIGLKSNTESDYDKSIKSIIYFSYLIEKAKEFFTLKLEGDEKELLKLDTASNINELIGHVWNKETLYENGLIKENQSMVQLAFNSYEDDARNEYVDKSHLYCLSDGKIYQSITYRPYKALKYIKAGDTIFDLINAEQLFIYPNNINQRVSYDKFTLSPINSEILQGIIANAQSDYSEVLKFSKKLLMSPLSDNSVKLLVKIESIEYIKTDSGVQILLADSKKATIALGNSAPDFPNIFTTNLLMDLDAKALKGCALFVSVYANVAIGKIEAMPLSVISGEKIVRLAY